MTLTLEFVDKHHDTTIYWFTANDKEWGLSETNGKFSLLYRNGEECIGNSIQGDHDEYTLFEAAKSCIEEWKSKAASDH